MIKHVAVEYTQNNILVYTHKIVDGKCQRNYGLEIAQKVLNLDEFTEKTNEIFNEISKKKQKKCSRYNRNVIVAKCEICKNTENLHTHHIVYQQNLEKNSPLKNVKSNLVVLCEKHHNLVHTGNLYINGWKQTSEGSFLDYSII